MTARAFDAYGRPHHFKKAGGDDILKAALRAGHLIFTVITREYGQAPLVPRLLVGTKLHAGYDRAFRKTFGRHKPTFGVAEYMGVQSLSVSVAA